MNEKLNALVPGKVALATAGGVVAADPLAELLNWGLGLIVANNGWAVPTPVAGALVLVVGTVVRVGWGWLSNRASQPAAS